MGVAYKIISKKQPIEGTFIFRLQPQKGSIFHFTAGQYAKITNPKFIDPKEEHPFSIASAPGQAYLEFCIKVYGDWTDAFSTSAIGDAVLVSGPFGKFTWDESISHAVFLLGGIGISPIMSILRHLFNSKQKSKITMLYGNRTPDTIAYKEELEELQKTLNLKVVHIFSDLTGQHEWKGYQGFITQDIVKKEIDLSSSPTFFFIGPPIFTEKMEKMLHDLNVPNEKIKQEILA